MDNRSSYNNYVQDRGYSLEEINPGSNEYALKFDDAFKAIDIVKKLNLPILGGDVLSMENGKLKYAYQIWGDNYHSLNWYCEQKKNETQHEYCIRSYEVAKSSMIKAKEKAEHFDDDCLFVLVV